MARYPPQGDSEGSWARSEAEVAEEEEEEEKGRESFCIKGIEDRIGEGTIGEDRTGVDRMRLHVGLFIRFRSGILDDDTSRRIEIMLCC